jgi:hypothetical protein
VHAFEGQVGSHGGLGGAQNLAVLLHPAELALDDDLLEDVGGARMPVGADRVHEQLVRWAAGLGLRGASAAGARAGGDPAGEVDAEAGADAGAGAAADAVPGRDGAA